MKVYPFIRKSGFHQTFFFLVKPKKGIYYGNTFLVFECKHTSMKIAPLFLNSTLADAFKPHSVANIVILIF